MNEELKIIIKVVSDTAKKAVSEVNSELEKAGKISKSSSGKINVSMKDIAKHAAVAVGAIAAMTAAFVNLGKAALEAQEGISKLNTTFQNLGSTGTQASTTYTQLFGFLGDHDKAIETAQSLALITTEEEKLAEWTNILQGAFAMMGEKMPTEGLAEAANETIKVGQVTGVMADALNWMGVSEDAFNESLAQTNSLQEREILVRSTLNNLYSNAAKIYEQNNKATIEYNQSQASLNTALSNAAKYTTPLLTGLNNLGATLLVNFGPALQTISLYLTGFIQLLAEAVQWVGNFFGIFSNETEEATANVAGYNAAMESYLNSLNRSFSSSGDSIDENIDKIKELKKQTMGFDELNIVSSPVATSGSSSGGSSGGGGGIGALPTAPNPSDYGIGFDLDFTDFQKDLEEAKERIKSILTIAGAVGTAILGWKLINFLQRMEEAGLLMQVLSANVKYYSWKLMQIGGIMAAIVGYSDAWVNDIDWANLALMIGGVAVALTGLYIQYGKLPVTIGAAAAAVALFVMYIKDFIKNGPTVQNTILLIGAAVATAVALATAGLSVLVSAIVAAVTAVAAFTVAVLLEEPAIMSVKDAQEALTAAKEAAAEAEMGYANAVDAAENALNRLKTAEEAAGITGEELYNQVQEGTLDYADMTDAQKECYKAYLDNEKKQKELKAATDELSRAKQAEILASYENQLALAKESGNYDEFKKSVIEAYKQGKISADDARMLIEKSMSEMSDASQQTFLKDLPGDIKDGLNPHKYESTKTKIVKFFKNVWADCKNVFGDMKDWFAKMGEKAGDALGSALKSVVNWILEKIENTINKPIRMINDAVDIINKIPGVNISKITEISVPRLARGGVVDSATFAMIGEQGKEAIVPLENNTEWMDKLADRIAARQAGPSKIVLKVGEKELGYATIEAINGITKQTGGLKLHLV